MTSLYLLLFLVLIQPFFNIFSGLFLWAKGVDKGEVIYWWLKSTWYFLAGFPMTILGLPIVAIGLLFKQRTAGTTAIFTDPRFRSNGNWELIQLPVIFKWWNNCFDGMLGDTRGWWDNNCRVKNNKTCRDFISMWKWAAIRNPCNYYSRVVTGCDVSQCVIIKLAGQDLADEDNPGWSFLVATDRVTGKKYHALWFCFPYFFNKNHAFYGKFGWKIKLKYNGTVSSADDLSDRLQGSVYRMSPWRAI